MNIKVCGHWLRKTVRLNAFLITHRMRNNVFLHMPWSIFFAMAAALAPWLPFLCTSTMGQHNKLPSFHDDSNTCICKWRNYRKKLEPRSVHTVPPGDLRTASVDLKVRKYLHTYLRLASTTTTINHIQSKYYGKNLKCG